MQNKKGETIIKIEAEELESTIKTEIINKLNTFIAEYNLSPKIIILNYRTYDELLIQLGNAKHILGKTETPYLEFYGIKVVRTSDIELNEIRFGF